MSKIRHLCLGVSSLSLLLLGLFSVQADAFAYAGCRNPHEIVAGENLSVIAAHYNVTVGELIEENGITNPNVISIGQVICIPNGAKKSNDSQSVWSQPRYNDGWGDYGVPGEIYDPAMIEGGDGASPEYGYGPQAESYSTVKVYWGVPGKAYDPVQVYAPEPQPTRSTADREFDEELVDPTPTPVPTPTDDGENGGNQNPGTEG